MVDMAEKMNETYWPNNETKLRIQPTEIAHGYHYGVGIFGSGFHITSGPSGTSVKISTCDPCQTNCFFEVKMSERPEMSTASYVPGGTAEVHVSLPGSASNSARSSGPRATSFKKRELNRNSRI